VFRKTAELNLTDRTFDLEERLISFAVRVIRVTEALPRSPMGRHIRDQLGRAGTAPAANYGEAQSAESTDDFVHKLKIVLKELRETRVWLLMIQQAALLKSSASLKPLLEEVNELISIFVASVKTASKKR
jgi:four helix bundle protein